MTPLPARQDWEEAMHNEAESAPDPDWAEQTERAAERLRILGGFGQSAAAFAALAAVQVLGVHFLTSTPPDWLWQVVMGLTGPLAFALTWRGLAPIPVGSAAIVYFPAAEAIRTALHALLPEQVLGSSGLETMSVAVLVILALCGAGLAFNLQSSRAHLKGRLT
ncbi:hypothetical protein ACFFLM_11555 [Deinococcus oregonensis]|uniref:Uncharacterized protein n=1 Tax=Deinococcus oregonensis TaxID=1805970 RepID=A0ABV6B2G7_9DEIO